MKLENIMNEFKTTLSSGDIAIDIYGIRIKGYYNTIFTERVNKEVFGNTILKLKDPNEAVRYAKEIIEKRKGYLELYQRMS